ncbi:DUF6099 family protein [Streptomyces sp. NPDC058657]|uniref:DUF6099 family protein n=1 Tax=unclassified Streptomyces TaxID=2593676 RepID=UPI0036469B73
MGIDDRLRDAARAVDHMWSDPETTAARYERMRKRLSDSQYSSGGSTLSADATRLIAVSRHALAGSLSTADILTEARQAQALAQAIGAFLAVTGPADLRDEALRLSEVAGSVLGVLDGDATAWAERTPRAAQLNGVSDPARTLQDLDGLLGEVGIALVGVASSTDAEAVYWQCIHVIEAAEESHDRVRGLLRQLAILKRESLTWGLAEIERRE